MKIVLQKIRVLGLKKHTKVLMKELQRKGILEIHKNDKFIQNSLRDQEFDENIFSNFDLSRIKFAINYLKPFAPKKGKMEQILTSGKVIISEEGAREKFNKFLPISEKIISSVENIEESLIRSKNQIKIYNHKLSLISSYKNLNLSILAEKNTDFTKTKIGKISKKNWKKLFENISQKSSLFDFEKISEDKKSIYLRITIFYDHMKLLDDVLQKFNFIETDFNLEFADFPDKTPSEIIISLRDMIKNSENEILKNQEKIKVLALHIEDLKIMHDFYHWNKEKNTSHLLTLRTNNLFAFEGWLPAADCEKLKHWLKQLFVGEIIMEKIEPSKNDKIPVLIKNPAGIRSFEMITKMFGLPKEKSIDPTLGMAPFFVIFFGICLSDVGYGSILFLVSSFFLLFGKLSNEAKTNLWMIFICGVSAIFGGILLGGWFGLTVEQFTLLVNPNTGQFYGQILDPLAGNGAMTFLIFTFSVGVIQLLFGLIMEFITKWTNNDKTGAFADSLAWMFFIISLLLWSLSDTFGTNKDLWQNFVLLGVAILVITQGREKWDFGKNMETVLQKIIRFIKNIFVKLIFGVLGLYGIMDYVSNMLSYSRLMALGLATGIIGSAMNMTALVLGDMIGNPILGIIVMIAFLIFGHSINFALSLLGAFIHSMRLQFIEFFGRFYVGGSPEFKPLKRVKEYILFK